MVELGEFRPVAEALKKHQGKVLAISVDPPETNRDVVERLKLPFPILSDVGAKVIADFGVLHAQAGPNQTDIAIPSYVLVGMDGRVLWKRVATRFQDRPDPRDVVAAVEQSLIGQRAN